jgi:hypothetical protein
MARVPAIVLRAVACTPAAAEAEESVCKGYSRLNVTWPLRTRIGSGYWALISVQSWSISFVASPRSSMLSQRCSSSAGG